tara:strand:+ start:4760 stop:6118 length:1359 start_codon:yes stop_codon:yes gene_type:complete
MKARVKPVITKYLECYAEPEASVGTQLPNNVNHVLVIPAHNEASNLLARLRPALDQAANRGRRTLVIIVINARDSDSSVIHTQNNSLLENLKTSGQKPPIKLSHSKDLPCWHISGHEFDLIAVDRTSEGHRFLPNDGVGLARKIGCDIALSSINAKLNTSSLIHTTDCDVTLPSDYFDQYPSKETAAFLYKFRHVASGKHALDEAHVKYEIFLRYYVLGLKHAGSPYGFHTIGSCIAVDPTSYARVRGVPKREAGEDFYLLNKLAKVGDITQANSNPIDIYSRQSLRVPFGTGRATYDLCHNPDPYHIYNPKIFGILKAWLTAASVLEDSESDHAYLDIFERACTLITQDDRSRLSDTLERLEAPHAIHKIARQTKNRAVRRKWFSDWFDGFRTLKFVHLLRDSGVKNLPWQDALTNAAFCSFSSVNSKDLANPGLACERLIALEDLQYFRK